MDLPETAATTQILLIASTPRCGSHLFGHMLGEHQGLGVPLEYLHPGNLRYWERRFRDSELSELFRKFLRHRTSSNGRFVTKAHWDQFAPVCDQLDQLTGGLGIAQAVWVYRRSLLSQAISLAIARQTGVWIAGAKPRGDARFVLQDIVSAALTVREQNAAWKHYFEARRQIPVMTIAYEDLIGSDPQAQSGLAEFLGLERTLVPAEKTASVNQHQCRVEAPVRTRRCGGGSLGVRGTALVDRCGTS
jgi:LPS sulfotransferase NodH